MAEQSAIGWTDHTFNPWWGCEKVSPACQNCYADTFARRTGHDLWGKNADRRFFGDTHWNEPVRWDKKAREAGRSALVFCASMADVFEDRRDLDGQRERLWDLTERTPNLIWLLLTKRPQHIRFLVPDRWVERVEVMELCNPLPVDTFTQWPHNVWVGATVEDQRRANERIPYLLDIPAPVRFLSCEPLLGAVDLTRVRYGDTEDCNVLASDDTGHETGGPAGYQPGPTIDWVICGGESGGKRRELELDHARALAAQCVRHHVPFFYKQGSGQYPGMHDELDGVRWKQFPTEAQRTADAQV